MALLRVELIDECLEITRVDENVISEHWMVSCGEVLRPSHLLDVGFCIKMDGDMWTFYISDGHATCGQGDIYSVESC